MKKVLGSLLREEKGQALPIALILLALGSLIIYPLVSLTHTSLASGRLEESRMYENYAANAGISDGLRQLIIDSPSLPAVGNNWSYSIPDTNDRPVTVTVNHIDTTTWRIDGTTASGDGHSTKINAYVDEYSVLPNAITSTSVTINGGAIVNGDVQYSSDNGSLVNNGTINGQIIDEAPVWPAIDDVRAFYLDQVQGAPTHEGDLIIIVDADTNSDPYSLGPIYINGDLKIQGDPEGTVRLDGIIYVEKNVEIGDQVRVLLNDNTVFTGDGSITFLQGSQIREHGCIISGKDIDISAGCTGGTNLTLWALTAGVNLNTTGEFWGSVNSGELNTLGNVVVQDGSTFTWNATPPDVLLPPLADKAFKITGWESTTS